MFCLHYFWDLPWRWPMLSGAVGSCGYPPALQHASHSPTLASRGQKVKKCQCGGPGHVLCSSHKPKVLSCWLFALLAHRGYGWRKVTPLVLTHPNPHGPPKAAPSGTLESPRTDLRQSDRLPMTSGRDLQKSSTYKINVFEHVFWRGLSNLLFPLSETMWSKMTPTPAEKTHLCYFFSPGSAVSVQASQWVPRVRGSHSSDESHQLQAVFLNTP